MTNRTRLATAVIVLAVAFSAACSDNSDDNAVPGTTAASQLPSADMPAEFDDALRELEDSMNDLGAATDRANDREYPPVEINTGEEAEEAHTTDTDYRKFCTDEVARRTELELRQRIAVKSWYYDLASSDQPMRDTTDEETEVVHKQVEEDFARDLAAFVAQHPGITCTT